MSRTLTVYYCTWVKITHPNRCYCKCFSIRFYLAACIGFILSSVPDMSNNAVSKLIVSQVSSLEQIVDSYQDKSEASGERVLYKASMTLKLLVFPLILWTLYDCNSHQQDVFFPDFVPFPRCHNTHGGTPKEYLYYFHWDLRIANLKLDSTIDHKCIYYHPCH